MIKIYGIPNCDKCREAKKWLDQNHVLYTFIDLKKHVPLPKMLRAWIEELGIDDLINRRGTTWRNLSDEVKFGFDEENCTELILENPTLLKRPIIDLNPHLLVGFDDKVVEDLIAHSY
ncbi:MAG: arsenate reductase [Rhodospirillaceae bacterium]|nr:arsenate reductase [Rhodospirillaceae bacterium]|tara:strand:+ start:3739 stop:4092 length:354 start_codon:yes stop_codon:yes gene_type:complete